VAHVAVAFAARRELSFRSPLALDDVCEEKSVEICL